jgi:hypothetical protein
MNRKEKMAPRRIGGGSGPACAPLPTLAAAASRAVKGLAEQLGIDSPSAAAVGGVAWSMLALEVEARITRFIRQMPYLGHDRGSLAEIFCPRSEQRHLNANAAFLRPDHRPEPCSSW